MLDNKTKKIELIDYAPSDPYTRSVHILNLVMSWLGF